MAHLVRGGVANLVHVGRWRGCGLAAVSSCSNLTAVASTEPQRLLNSVVKRLISAIRTVHSASRFYGLGAFRKF